jgi:hypothetical protein
MAAGGNALHDNMSPTRRQRRPLRLHWAVALMPPPSPQVETGRRTRHRRCPPRLPHLFFLHDFAPPLSLRHGLSCGASPAPTGCRLANYLDMPPSLLSLRLVVALLPLSLRCCLSLCHLSHCAAVSLSHRPSQPQ